MAPTSHQPSNVDQLFHSHSTSNKSYRSQVLLHYTRLTPLILQCSRYPNILHPLLSMATETKIHETPAWEAPALKKGLFSKFSLPTKTNTPAESKEAPLETSASETGTVKRTFSDKWLPHWLACMGRSRKSFLCSVAALVLLLLLIIGLGLGLGLSHKSWVNLDTFHPGTAI